MTRHETSSSTSAIRLAIRLDDVHFSYQSDWPVITGCDAVLDPGRLCALVGPNAAGKSTLLRLILGQLKPQRGLVTVHGRPVSDLSSKQRARWVSYVPQRSHCAFTFTVQQVVAMGRHALGIDDSVVDQALEDNDLASLRDSIYTQLSAGQQQRVLLARAMAQASGGGKVMLLDEPTSALDLFHVHQTMAQLVQLARSGLAVLVVLHDLNLAAQYADDVWILHQGRFAAVGSWQRVLVSSMLEPVYGTPLRTVTLAGRDRPLFMVDPSDSGLPAPVRTESYHDKG